MVMPGSSARQALIRWWTDDFEPLQGPLRFIFYAGLLILALTGTFRSPMFAQEVFEAIDPLIYTPMGQ